MIDEDAEAAIVLRPRGYFRYDKNLDCLASAPLECMYRIADRRLRRAVRIGSAVRVVEVRESENGGVEVRAADGGTMSRGERDHIAALAAEWFDLDTEPSAFYAMAGEDALLGPVTERFRGLRILGIPDLFEAVCWAIIGQQINLTFAYALKRRFVEAYGEAAELDGQTYWAFPLPRTVAALEPEALAALGISRRKCEYLIEAARAVEEGRLSKEALRAAGSPAEAERMLTAIRGIGSWTAHYVLMRCLRLRSAFPEGDAGLHNAVKRLLGADRKPTADELRALFAPWAGWEAYAVFYLWRLLY